MFQFSIAFVTLFPLFLGGPSTFDTEQIWVPGNLLTPFPRNAIPGGSYPDGRIIYVGRVLDMNQKVTFAKILPEIGTAYTGHVSNDGHIYGGFSYNYEILVSHSNMTYEWARSYDGFYEKGAVIAGISSLNEPITVCRSRYNGSLIPGYLSPSLKKCFIFDTVVSDNGGITIESNYTKYEILRATPKLC